MAQRLYNLRARIFAASGCHRRLTAIATCRSMPDTPTRRARAEARALRDLSGSVDLRHFRVDCGDRIVGRDVAIDIVPHDPVVGEARHDLGRAV